MKQKNKRSGVQIYFSSKSINFLTGKTYLSEILELFRKYDKKLSGDTVMSFLIREKEKLNEYIKVMSGDDK